MNKKELNKKKIMNNQLKANIFIKKMNFVKNKYNI